MVGPGSGTASLAGTETPSTGLTAAGVAERVAAGRTNATSPRTSRTVGEIVRANVFTVFNGVLATLFVLVMTTGRWQNALFGLVVVANAAIGIVQELRAKRTLDRLAILNAPRALVVRDGADVDVPVADVVLDDLLALATGDQVPADGVVRTATGLELDESLLTGEAEPVDKHPGDAVWSGAFVVVGARAGPGDGGGGGRLRGPAVDRGPPVHLDLLRAGGRHEPAAALDRGHAPVSAQRCCGARSTRRRTPGGATR